MSLALPAMAQVSTSSLGGRVSDGDGPLEGVTVVAIHQPTNSQYYATTDARGRWQMLDLLPGGPYTLRIHYFGYDPISVRELYLYISQNTVVDADLEARTTRIVVDDAATSLRIGEGLGGGVVPVAPGTYDLVGQRVYAEVPFDVRQDAELYGATRLQVTPTGTSRFHGSLYGYYGLPLGTEIPGQARGLFGATVSTPIASEDFLLYGGLQYDLQGGLMGTGRFDARFNEANRLDISGGRLSSDEYWAMAGLSSAFLEGRASNRAQAGWYGDAASRSLAVSDNFTYVAGAQRLMAGVQFSRSAFTGLDSAATQVNVYLQDAIRLGRRVTLLAGLRFDFPFTFSPRLSLHYDILGTGKLVLRAGTAVYGRHGEGSVWKNLAAVDIGLPAAFRLTLEGVYGQSWRRLFYISTHNVLDSHYALTARLERPLANRLWAVASYTRSDGSCTDNVIGGFSYKAVYGRRFATMLSALYVGGSYVDDDSPASMSWSNSVEARLTQDFGWTIGSRDHALQLTAYARYAPAYVSSGVTPGLTRGLTILAGLRYTL